MRIGFKDEVLVKRGFRGVRLKFFLRRVFVSGYCLGYIVYLYYVEMNSFRNKGNNIEMMGS